MKYTSVLENPEFKLNKDYYPYFTYKKAKNKSKGTFLFIHGYGFDSSYHNFFAKLDDDYDYYAIELPGHGVTPKKSDKDLSPWAYAEMTINLIKKLRLSHINLIGHSMGGGIAMMVASRIPLLINRLILVSPMNSFGTTNIKDFILHFNPKSIKEANKFYDIVLYDKNWLNDDWAGDVIDRLLFLNNNEVHNFKTLKRNMMSIKNILNLAKSESNIKNKTLLIIGEDDKCINPRTTIMNLSKRIPKIKVIKFEHCGHIPMFENLGKYRNEIIDFINEK